MEKKRYSLEQIPSLDERERMANEIMQSRQFWKEKIKNQTYHSTFSTFSVWIVRCGGCGRYMTENSLEYSNAKITYYCSYCTKETIKEDFTFLPSSFRKKKRERYFEQKRKEQGILLSDIFVHPPKEKRPSVFVPFLHDQTGSVRFPFPSFFWMKRGFQHKK